MTTNSAHFLPGHRWRILLAIVLTLAAVGVALGLALTRSQASPASSTERQPGPSVADACGRTYFVQAC